MTDVEEQVRKKTEIIIATRTNQVERKEFPTTTRRKKQTPNQNPPLRIADQNVEAMTWVKSPLSEAWPLLKPMS